MAYKEIIIRKQSTATRCEICHQTDQFNLTTGVCSRCADLTIQPTQDNYTPVVVSQSEDSASFTALFAAIFGITAFVPGLCFPPLAVALGLIGIILGRTENTNIQNGLNSRAGENFTYIGIYCGLVSFMIGLVLTILIISRTMR